MTASVDGPGYPLLLDLAGRRAVVVGGGPVAARRVAGLLDAGAAVTVVAPELCDELAALLERIAWEARTYDEGDLAGAWVVQTATGDHATDALVAAHAEAERIWCVRADDAEHSSAWTPAVARVDGVVVAVSADRDPRRAKAISEQIGTRLQTGELSTRRRRRGPAHGQPGRVSLIGGGPGDPDLITTRGRRLLANADVVLVDRLAPRALLDELDASVEVVDAGKGPLSQALTQERINELIIERARSGQRVVRLKGGDPFVFGRGAEEARACAAAGVPCEVVPGVTSATAVPLAAGIPVTHREVTRQFTVVSANSARAEEGPDYPTLAKLDGTLVFLMGVGALRDLAAALVQHGRAPTTPVAVVERGTLPSQRTTLGTLADIADRARDRQARSPAVIVVGSVVDAREIASAYAETADDAPTEVSAR